MYGAFLGFCTVQIICCVEEIVKLEEDASLSWRQSKQDKNLYPILENDRVYTEWIIKTKRWFVSEECDRMIDPNFQDNQVNGGAETLLFEA